MNTIIRSWSVAIVIVALSGILGCAKSPAVRQTQDVMRADNDEAKKIIVATVNSAPITMDSLIRMMNRMDLKNHGDPAPDYMEKTQKAALDRLILQELAYQKAKAMGIAVKQKNIDDSIANLKGNMGGETAYEQFLKQQALSEAELRAQVERSLSIEQIVAKEVYQKAAIPQEELQNAYEKEKARYVAPEKVKITDVIVFVKTDEQAARKKTGELLKKIQADKDRNPWNLVLDGTFLVRNIDLKKEKEKQRQLYEAAIRMKPGNLSKIMKNDEGFHIVKLLEYSPERQMTFDEIKGSLEGNLRVTAQQKRMDEWTIELKKDAKIEMKDSMLSAKQAPGGEKKN